MKKFLLWTWVILLTPVLLFLIVVLLLYLPPVQNYVVHRVASYMSETTGSKVSVGNVSLSFPLDLSINDILFIQPNDSLPQVRDTIADVGNIIADVKLWPLVKGRVEVANFEINKAKVNTDGFIPDVRVKGTVEQLKAVCNANLSPVDSTRTMQSHEMVIALESVSLKKSRIDVVLGDTAAKDTTSTPANYLINVRKVDIEDTGVTVHLPGDTLQM